MNNDPFDRELAGRLAAYESLLPDAAPPSTDAALRTGGPRSPLIGVAALAAVAAVLALAVLVGGARDDIGHASPSPSAAASATAEPSISPTAVPASDSAGPSIAVSPSAPDPSADLAWTEAASFPAGGASSVSAVVAHYAGLVAVGVAYEEPLPILGPLPPHQGRVWLSPDGIEWDDVTPADTFDRTSRLWLLVAADGALVAHGWQDSADGIAAGTAVTFESGDGRIWEAVDQPFGEGAWPNVMAQGARGSAAVVVDPAGPTFSVWWSADGRTWERVHDLGDQASFALGAGDEGFVVAGTRVGSDGAEEPFAIASGDGREWIEAETPPGAAVAVAPRGGDWLAISRDPTAVLGQPAEAEVWASANGLTWTPIGGYSLGTSERSDVVCSELPDALLSAGEWLLSGTTLSFGCSEGGVQTKGTQLISRDGVDWAALPFGAPAVEAGLGTKIAGAIEVDGRLVLVGERDRVATFWIGEQP